MYRTFVIIRHTFAEAIMQPVYPLLLALALAVLGIYAFLPFFTLGEDVVMYKAVGLDVILIAVLLVTLFAASKSIFEEIEDRTMLTLMSKPVSRWEVLVGKYLGLLLSAGLGVALLGAVLVACVWYRVPGDYNLSTTTLDDRVVTQVRDLRVMHVAGLAPQLVLLWMQIGVLIAVSVAISTRFSLVVNVPAVILVYIAGNLTRFVEAAADASGWLARAGAFVLNTVLPFLKVFDLTDLTVYEQIAVPGTQFAGEAVAVNFAALWVYVLVAGVYFAAYVTFILCLGYGSFVTRELGGAEG